MNHSKKCSPAIRIKGFTDDWEQRKLGETVKIIMGQSPDSKNYTNNPNDHILVQGNADMKNGFVFPRVWTTQITKTANKNNLILSVRAPVGDIGKTNYDVVLGRGVAAIQGNEFIYQTLVKMKLNHFWENLSSGSTFDSINSNDLKNVLIFFPSDKEQTQIGNFFKQLDETIALHKRTLEKHQNLKKFYLEKMFPKENQQFPEIRFPNFTDAWEQRKLLDNIENIIDFRGRTPKKLGMNWADKGFLALSALNVKNGYIDPKVDANFGDEELYQKWMGSNDLVKGQVLFTTEAPMGNVAQVPDDKKYILSQRTIAFCINKKMITNDFLAVLLRSPKVFSDLESFSSGGTAKGVSQKSLENLEVKQPKLLSEQTQIGNFFKQLDETIALHKRKVEKFEKIKQAYLEKMFI